MDVSLIEALINEHGKDIYNFCVYYPEILATSFVGIEEDDEDIDE